MRENRSREEFERDETEGRREVLEPSSTFGINPRDRGVELLDLAAEFGNEHPVILEIGSGKGRFLVTEATEHPDRNYLGIEMALQYFRIIRDRLERRDLENVRIVNYDAKEVISRMLPAGSIAECHIYFPDPWPKKKQKKRRFVQDENLRQVDRILVEDGSGVFVTDHAGYFEDAVPVFERWFRVEAAEVTSREPRTNYEAKYREEGRRIHEIRFFKR